MSRTKRASTAAFPNEINGRNAALKHLGGSRSDAWNFRLAADTVQTLGVKHADAESRDLDQKAVLGALEGIAPQDVLQGMMAAQLIASHNAAMQCHHHATIAQSFESRRENLNLANKLSRTYATLAEALNRHRGKGQQKVTVEHVHIHSGGQAMVGVVEAPGGGDRTKLEDQPHAKQITHAPRQAMRCTDAEREPVPLAGHAERPLPDARRPLTRRPKG